MNLLRRHPVALALLVLLLVTAIHPLPPLVDVITGSAPGDADLDRPVLYVLFAPLSNTLDALTFFSLPRAIWALVVWMLLLAAAGAVRASSDSYSMRRVVATSLIGPALVVLLVLVAVLVPRPVPRIVTDGPGTVLDYHAHTNASHDGRPGWTLEKLAAWHERQGFQATYVTDHNLVYDGSLPAPTGTSVRLLPGVEWSVHEQHVVAIGPVEPLPRDSFTESTARMVRIFGAIERQGALSIASLPEYWRHHQEDLDAFVTAGVDGFEVVNCSPKALGFPTDLRRQVISIAGTHDLMVVGASDNHGWGAVTCVWNVSQPGAGGGFRMNRVFVRPLALAQGEWAPWTAPVTQPWFMFRSLAWSERVSWLTWVLVILLYRVLPRRQGQPAGLGILARSVFRRPRGDAAPNQTPT